MGEGKVAVTHGCVRLQDGNKSISLSAADVCNVVFEGSGTIHGVTVSADDLFATGLRFREYTADPILLLHAVPSENPTTVACRLIARAIDFEADVMYVDGKLLDYAVDVSTWMPLPTGTDEAAQSFLNQAGLSDFGPISLAAYLKILQLPDPPLTIEDRTNQAFSATQLATRLAGDVPPGLMGTLYPYQTNGYRWLACMSRNGLGSIIADEMGLGKTIQVICLLLDRKNHGHGPGLVVVPATLLENWRRELARFAPSLKVRLHRGPKRTGFPDDLRQEDVVLTSYETAVADVSLLRNVSWDLLILDEAQAIKNPTARRTMRLKTLPRQCAIAVTGTPMENHLTDLWSLMDFVVPSLLGTQKDFECRHPDTMSGATTLEPVLTPIILRRRVVDVAQDLPPRIDIPQPLELDPESADVYEALRTSAADSEGAALAMLGKLRMFCTHPWLVDQFTHFQTAVDCSVKLKRLLEIIEEIVTDNGKALVFTSYQESVDLLEREISVAFGIHTDGIDGRTKIEERQPKIDRFSALREPSVLVLNPRAAGTGLNITAANHVIHFNLEWNPAVEDQASARAHRRGQTQTVTVHRLFYVDTVEDVINDRMARKRQMALTAVVGTDGAETEVKDILRALRISPVNRTVRGLP